MTLGGRFYSLALFVGDLIFFIFALWLTLALRYWAWPDPSLLQSHAVPFSLLFLIWALVYFIYDLYRPQTLIFGQALPARIIRAQVLNSLLAVLIFYFIPYFGVTPKTNLFLDLIISSGLVLLWRRYLANLILRARRLRVALDCAGAEVDELRRELAANLNHQIVLTDGVPAVMVVNRYDSVDESRVAELYRLLFRGVRFISVQDFYEEIFGRVPLSLLNERWFLERVSGYSPFFYDLLKRSMDLVVGLALGLLSLVVYPFVIAAIKLEDGGPIFFYDRRVGRFGKDIRIAKFRTMSLEPDLADRRVTRVGHFLRHWRLDELPQLWSVVAGRQSLIGPRPERREYVELYRERIPFYDARHLIAPGLSGWAQIYHENHPHFSVAEDATREKLAYDLYYVKNRGPWLDIKIGLKTIKTLLSRSGK